MTTNPQLEPECWADTEARLRLELHRQIYSKLKMLEGTLFDRQRVEAVVKSVCDHAVLTEAHAKFHSTRFVDGKLSIDFELCPGPRPVQIRTGWYEEYDDDA